MCRIVLSGYGRVVPGDRAWVRKLCYVRALRVEVVLVYLGSERVLSLDNAVEFASR